MKYKVGDYLRLGVIHFNYYRIIGIEAGKYRLLRSGDDSSFLSIRDVVEGNSFSFKQVTKVEYLLFAKKRSS